MEKGPKIQAVDAVKGKLPLKIDTIKIFFL